MKFIALLFCLALLAAGCGSDDKSSAPPPTILPNAATPDEWAGRIVNRLMRPMNKNLQVLGTLNNPQIKIYIEQENPATLRILKNRMTDLGKCSDRLLTIGPPPADANNIKQLRQVDAALHRACPHYVKVSETVLKAVEMLSSGRAGVVADVRVFRGVPRPASLEGPQRSTPSRAQIWLELSVTGSISRSAAMSISIRLIRSGEIIRRPLANDVIRNGSPTGSPVVGSKRRAQIFRKAPRVER